MYNKIHLSFFLFIIVSVGQGQEITTVKIGAQTWMQENLKVYYFRNGDPIERVQTDKAWDKAGVANAPIACSYTNTSQNEARYGMLYNWYAVTDPRGLCPSGWRVPSNHDWKVLKKYLGGKKTAGGAMKSTKGWADPNLLASNSSGFTALPGGSRDYFGEFLMEGSEAVWWSSNEQGRVIAWARLVQASNGRLNKLAASKGNGNSVRCIKE